MPKTKTHKGMARRIKVTAKGKIRHKKSGSSHLMSHMTGGQVRSLRKPVICSRSVAKKMEGLLGRSLTGR